MGNELLERYYYIDFLRIAAIFMMFIFHVNMIFVSEWGWHIKNDSQSNVLMEVNYWMQFFRMPLLFFVSGFITCVLLDKLSNLKFVVQRFNRLIIPTIIWTFILVAPQIYFERKLQGAEFNYIEFYGEFLDFELYPKGNFHWLHLWFIPYLFAYNLVSIPIYRTLQSYTGDLASRLTNKNIQLLVFAFFLFAILPYTLLSVHYPATYDMIHDYARHAKFIPFVIAGMLAYQHDSIMIFLEEKRAVIFRLALLSIFIINVVRWNGVEPRYILEDWLSKPISYCYLLLLNSNSWLWVLALLGYGKKYLNSGSKTLSYCNKAVYPFYILHQTVIVVLAYYVVQTADNAAFKYVFLLFAGFFITIALYHFYIRPSKLVRFLFGAK